MFFGGGLHDSTRSRIRVGVQEQGLAMGIDFAIDELYATGWSPLDTGGCLYHTDARPYPSCARVEQEFSAAGCSFNIRRIQLFDCHRAEWADATGTPLGAVVGHSMDEAAVYALSQLRRGLVTA